MADLTREQLIAQLQQHVARRRVLGSIWWDGELLPVGEALGRAYALPTGAPIFAHGDEIVTLGLSPRRAGT